MNSRTLSIRENRSFKGAESYDRTLLKLFLAAAPNLINENNNENIAQNIAFSIVGTKYHNFWPFGRANTSDLIADFVALDLVDSSKKKHSLTDKSSYWSLTKLGKLVHKNSRRIQLEEGINTSNENLKVYYELLWSTMTNSGFARVHLVDFENQFREQNKNNT